VVVLKVMDMQGEGSEMQYTDGIHRQVEMLGQLSVKLNEYFALRSLGGNGKEDRY
jgi:hypothetical protein